ncbi:Serine protease inhibitor [Pyrobaculum oguniense TE7]|uniref:Serine protease inhibitor n=1 Tax=Pyrobaculum oguniense (strain DSM 13380 / JCM 10595 / TE7) TaxID=698757 RepID=H6QAS5_PYROT|nr:Serine protease inhibitor [Pyrobaculum oguniense TE7]
MALDAYGRFAVELYKRAALGRLGENIALSPYSVYKAFAMAYAGTSGTTKGEIRRTFSFADELCLLPSAGRWLEDAASAWLQRGFPFKESYLLRLSCIGAEAKWADFAGATSRHCRRLINGFRREPRGLVRDLVPEDYPRGEGVRAVLISAVFFHGTWWPERSMRVDKREFKCAGPVELMRLSLTSCADPSLRGFISDDLTVVELPFNNSDVALYVVGQGIRARRGSPRRLREGRP